MRIADELEAHEAAILDANAVDVTAAERRHIDATLLQRLRLKPAKLRTLAAGIRAIAAQEEPLRKARSSRKAYNIMETEKKTWYTSTSRRRQLDGRRCRSWCVLADLL